MNDDIQQLQNDLQQLFKERRVALANGEQEQEVLLDLDIAILRQKIDQLKAT